MSVNVILATDLDYGIGNENKLPWPKNKKDLEWFKNHTLNDVVVMGRKTWDSLGCKKLPNRTNIVITSKKLEGPDNTFHGNMENIIEDIKKKYSDKDIWIIGGAEIYNQTIPFADKLYLTTFNNHYKCDTYVEKDIIIEFPVIKYWKENKDIIFQIRSKV